MNRLLSPYLLNVNVVIVGDRSCVDVCTTARCRHSGGTPGITFLPSHSLYTAIEPGEGCSLFPFPQSHDQKFTQLSAVAQKITNDDNNYFLRPGSDDTQLLFACPPAVSSLFYDFRFDSLLDRRRLKMMSWFLIDASRR